MPIKWKFWLLYLLFLSVNGAFSQNEGLSIKGRVHTTDNAPLKDAVVYLVEPGLTRVTDAQGVFSFRNMPPGKYTLHVSAMGFHASTRIVELITEKEVLVDIYLRQEVMALDEVVLTHASTYKTDTYASETIKTADMQHQSVETNKLLETAAGIRVRQDGGLGSRANYMINGLNGRSVRFFLDEVPMDYFGSSYSANTIPVSQIQKIEVYKGVVPVELGSDALGGAINIVSKNNLRNAAEGSYSFGSFNTHRVALSGNYRHDSTGFTIRFNGFFNHSDNNYHIWGDNIYLTDTSTFEVRRGLKVRRFNDMFTSQATKTDIGFSNKKWADICYLGLMQASMQKGIQHGTTMEVPFGEARYAQKVLMPYLIYKKYDLLKGLDVNLFAAYSDLSRDLTDTSSTIYNWLGESQGERTLGGERRRSLNRLTEKVLLNRLNLVYHLNARHKIGFNTVISSTTRTDRDPILTNITDGYWAPQHLHKQVSGLSLQSNWFKEKLTTSLFCKHFNYSADIKSAEITKGITYYRTTRAFGSSAGYGLASTYHAGNLLTLNASYEKAYRLPEADEILGDGILTLGTTNLNPELSDNYNLGARSRILSSATNTIDISANTFHRNVSDLIQVWQYDQNAFVHINLEQVRISGFDLKVTYQYKKLIQLSNNISYFHSSIRSHSDALGNKNLLQGSRVPNVPYFQNHTHISISKKNLIQKNSEASLYYIISYIGSFYRHSELIGKHNKDIIPAQHLHSCGASYTFPGECFIVSVDMSNIFNRQAFDNFAIQRPGRAAYIKLTYRLDRP